MSDYIFLFDLDSTITKEEILPTISKKINKYDEMRELTELTMNGEIPFKTSFLKRVEILKDVNVFEIKKIVENIKLNDEIAKFIIENNERCYIVTGNLDIWISDLMLKLKMDNHVYCSKAVEHNEKLINVISIADKELIAKQFVQPIVVVGDGDNDSGIAKYADIAIGFGGVRDIAPSLLENIDFAFHEDKRCADFLKGLL